MWPATSCSVWRRTMAAFSCSTARAPRRAPATVRPFRNLVHGGPGRAGGGEELGGVRGVLHYMQRTALQGSPSVITAVTREWVAGAAETVDPAVHPFRKHFEELRIGETLLTGTGELSRWMTSSGSPSSAGIGFMPTWTMTRPARTAFSNGGWPTGYFVVSAAAGLFVDPAPCPVLANYGLENLRFVKPVYPWRHDPGCGSLASRRPPRTRPRGQSPRASSPGTSTSAIRTRSRWRSTRSLPWCAGWQLPESSPGGAQRRGDRPWAPSLVQPHLPRSPRRTTGGPWGLGWK